jgi:hypothetical protein
MMLFNETVGVDKDIEQEWLHWMQQKHIPEVLNTGMFISAKIYKVLHDQDDGTVSYSIQYFAESIDHIQQFLEVFAPVLVAEHRQKFMNKHVAFRTLLEEVA